MAEENKKESTIVSKLVDLLSKTKDALIADLKAEFVSVREAIEESNEVDKNAVFSLEKQLNSKVNIIDAIFVKVGYDISHYENLNTMKQTVLTLVSTIDGLANDIRKLVGDSKEGITSDNVADFAEAALPHIQSILSLVKDLADTEWKNVEAECIEASQDIKENIENNFLTKDFGRKVLDHILITLLKNAKDVFKDEIDFVRISASNLKDEIQTEVRNVVDQAYDLANGIKKDVNDELSQGVSSLLKESLVEYKEIRERLVSNISDLKSDVVGEIQKFVNSEAYEKLSRAFSITYSILDFLGVIQEKQITLKLPASLQNIITTVENKINEGGDGMKEAITNLSNKVSQANTDLQNGIDEAQEKLVSEVQDASTVVTEKTSKLIGEMNQDLQVTKEIANLSVSAIGAVSAQLNSLYDEEKGLVNNLKGFSDGISSQINSALGTANNGITDACKTVTDSLEKVKNFTYPVKIVTISWNSVETLFTKPVSHFKALYPIDSVDDAENLMRRLMGIMHQINPDIPDFDSLRNLLESLLKRLQQRVIKLINEIKEKAKDAANTAIKKIKEIFEPIITAIRRVIEMLREIAVALKNRMYGVLNDVKKELSSVMAGAQEVIGDVQNAIKNQVAEYQKDIENKAGSISKELNATLDSVTSGIGEFFDNADKLVEGVGKSAEELLKESADKVEGKAQEISQETKEWINTQKTRLSANINMPSLVKKTLAEPVLNCITGIINDVPNIKLENPLPMSAIVSLHGDIMALQAQLGKSILVGEDQLKISFSDVIKGATNMKDIPSIPSIKDLGVLNIVEEATQIIEPQLQAWSYGVLSSIRSVASPSVWKERMDNIVTQLQAEFQNDLGNITGLMSKEGVQKIFNDSSSVKKQLKDNLQISDYITIVQGSLSEVVLPNPELYFDSLKSTLSNIVGQLIQLILDKISTVKEKLEDKKKEFEDFATNWWNGVKDLKKEAIEKVVNSIIAEHDKLKECAGAIADRVIAIKDNILNLIENIKSYLSDLKSYFTDEVVNSLKSLKSTIEANITSLKDNFIENIKNKLSDLANEIWSKIKAEVITPIIKFIKDRIIAVVKEKIRQALQKIIESITEVQEKAKEAYVQAGQEVKNLESQLVNLPCFYELSKAIGSLCGQVESKIKNNQELKDALKGIEGIGSDFKITNLKELPVILKKLQDAPKLGQQGKSLLTELCSGLKLEIATDMDEVRKELEKNVKKEVGEKAKQLENLIESKTRKIEIPVEYIVWVQSLIQSTMDFVQSDMGVKEIVNLVSSVYDNIPDTVKDKAMDILPSLPSLPNNAFTKELKKISCDYDLDNKFCNVTLLNLDKKNIIENDKVMDSSASLLIQMFMFVGTYSSEEETVSDSEGNEVTISEQVEDENGVISVEAEEVKEGKPAIYFMFLIKGEAKFTLKIGDKHALGMTLDASAGADCSEVNKPKETKNDKDKDAESSKEYQLTELPESSLGFCFTKKTSEDPHYFHGFGSTDSLSALFSIQFNRIKEKEENKAKILSTKYLDINISDYPQVAYVLYNHDYPEKVKEALNIDGFSKIEEKDDKDQSSGEKAITKASGFSAGYMAAIEGLEIVLKLRENEFFKQILKDDISTKFNLSLLYDYKEGFKIGGGYNFHLDIDCSNLELGKLRLQNLGIDIGSLKNDWGTLQFQLGSTFDVNFGPMALSFENLGIGMNLNVIKPDFSLGDWDFDGHFKFPSGIGIAVDTSVVKGSGLVSYDDSTGELMGFLDLNVIKKFGLSAFVLADLGTVAGHSFNLVAIVSVHFNPGIPLGMGFSLTGIGGCLGLKRMIDQNAVTTAVRQGTLASVFFVENPEKHLSEMKATALAIFPAKDNQFFIGFLGQISYAPVLSCDFGLLFQMPDPCDITIVGSLKVTVSDSDVIRINVVFAGSLDFNKGIKFDASLVDSQIVGIKLEGSMAFRLFWGGDTKGFLLSIGGFHPDYTPEPGMLVGDMKRLSMKLDYSILKIGLQTYLAVTSNSFQIGARLDLQIGWSKFGITGYLGFDALFQFDPFMFMFSAECGVSVKCGSWKLLSIDLALNVSGPAPWHVSGKAKFKFLFIPISVDFSKEWGNSKPQLPEKTIAVIALLDDEMSNVMNWTTSGSDVSSSDEEVVIDRSCEEGVLLIQPFESLSFNQSAVPLNLERSMDLCNNAVPTDYDNLRMSSIKFGGEPCVKEEEIETLDNDFAPSLFFNMTQKEKLSSPSYEQYNSGFTVNAAETRKTNADICESLSREYEITVKTKTSSTTQKAESDTSKTVSRASARTLRKTAAKNETVELSAETKKAIGSLMTMLTSAPGSLISMLTTVTMSESVKEQTTVGSKVGYAIKDKNAFDRYVKLLDSKNNR